MKLFAFVACVLAFIVAVSAETKDFTITGTALTLENLRGPITFQTATAGSDVTVTVTSTEALSDTVLKSTASSIAIAEDDYTAPNNNSPSLTISTVLVGLLALSRRSSLAIFCFIVLMSFAAAQSIPAPLSRESTVDIVVKVPAGFVFSDLNLRCVADITSKVPLSVANLSAAVNGKFDLSSLTVNNGASGDGTVAISARYDPVKIGSLAIVDSASAADISVSTDSAATTINIADATSFYGTYDFDTSYASIMLYGDSIFKEDENLSEMQYSSGRINQGLHKLRVVSSSGPITLRVNNSTTAAPAVTVLSGNLVINFPCAVNQGDLTNSLSTFGNAQDPMIPIGVFDLSGTTFPANTVTIVLERQENAEKLAQDFISMTQNILKSSLADKSFSPGCAPDSFHYCGDGTIDAGEVCDSSKCCAFDCSGMIAGCTP